MNDKQVNIVVNLKDNASKAIQNIQDSVGTLKERLGSNFANIQSSVDGFNAKLLNLAKTGLKVATVGAVGLGVAVGKIGLMGSDYNRLQIATDQIAENMGYGAEQVREWQETLLESNTTGSNALNVIKGFMQSGLVPMIDTLERGVKGTEDYTTGFNAFTLVAKDFGASMGYSSGEAIEMITKALVRQEPALLENLGIQFRQIEVYKRIDRKSVV